MDQTRGERNNNPGNINYSISNPFVGQLSIEDGPNARFGKFDTAEHGIRAIAKLIQTYINKDMRNTVTLIINSWAPPSDHNNTEAYIDDVCKDLGVLPNHLITAIPNNLVVIVRAIIRHENGRCIYPDDLIKKAVNSIFTP